MNLFENILAKVKTNFANQDPTQNLQYKAINKLAGGVSAVTWQGMEDPTQSLLYKWLQSWANLYTWTAEEASTWWRRDFDLQIKNKQEKFISDMLAKWYDKNAIFEAMDSLKAEWAFDYKPSFMGRVTEWLGNRMQEVARTTDTLSNVQNPLQRLGVGTLAYGGDVVATAMEPVASAISPIVQSGIEKAWLTDTVQNLWQKYQWFKERNPLTADVIEWVANIWQLAPIPVGKVAWKVLKPAVNTTGKAIVSTAEKVAPKVVQGAKVATDLATAPVKSIVNTARKYVATPEEISGIQSAIKPKQRVKNWVVQRSQDAINKEITLTNSLIRQSGTKPTDLATYKTAIKSEMEKIGSEINRLTGQDLTIDITPSTAKLRQLANSDIVKTLDPADTNALLGLADRLDANGGRMSLSMAEEMNQWLNSVLKDTTVPKSEAYKRGLMTLVEDIRNWLDDSISTIPWQFKEIKKAYWALRNVYGDTVAREIVFNRQNMGGLVDSIGAIEWAGNIVSWGGKILMWDVRWGVADIWRGIASNAVGRFIKTKNDPNNIIRAIFEKWGNKSIIPNIPNKPTNGNIPWNSTNTSPVLDMGTTKKSEWKVIKPAKAKPIVKPSPQVKPVEKTVRASEKKVETNITRNEAMEKWFSDSAKARWDKWDFTMKERGEAIKYLKSNYKGKEYTIDWKKYKVDAIDNRNEQVRLVGSEGNIIRVKTNKLPETKVTDKNIFDYYNARVQKWYKTVLSPQKTVKPKN